MRVDKVMIDVFPDGGWYYAGLFTYEKAGRPADLRHVALRYVDAVAMLNEINEMIRSGAGGIQGVFEYGITIRLDGSNWRDPWIDYHGAVWERLRNESIQNSYT